MSEFTATIDGQEVLVDVTHYEPYIPATFDDPAEGSEIEFTLPNDPDLEAALTDSDVTDVFDQFEKHIQDQKEEAKIDDYESRMRDEESDWS